MVEGRPVAFAPGKERTLFLRHYRPLGYLMKGYLAPLMADPHAPVDQLLHHDPLRTDLVLYLVEHPLILDGMVILEGPFRLFAENRIEIDVFKPAVEVLFTFRRYTETFVVGRQIGGEEPVGFFYGFYSLKPHLLN